MVLLTFYFGVSVNFYDNEDANSYVSRYFIIRTIDIFLSDEKSPFTIVMDEDGKESIVKKSCLVWMLTEPSVGLSKDRLRRVQVTKKRKHDQV